MLEREIEKRFGRMLKSIGCLYYKFVSPGNPGVPDRIVVCPDGRLYFVELKTESGRLSEQQKTQIKRLRTHGQAAITMYGLADCMQFVDNLKKRTSMGGGLDDI